MAWQHRGENAFLGGSVILKCLFLGCKPDSNFDEFIELLYRGLLLASDAGFSEPVPYNECVLVHFQIDKVTVTEHSLLVA